MVIAGEARQSHQIEYEIATLPLVARHDDLISSKIAKSVT